MTSIEHSTPDNAGPLVRPPAAWAATIGAGLLLGWLAPLPFPRTGLPLNWTGAAVFALALALAGWATVAMQRGGSSIPTHLPTERIVAAGPYRFSRNPIYLAMFASIVGLAGLFDTVWLLVALAPFVLVIRCGVVAREEAYLARKFGDGYGDYRRRVRRWL